VAITQSYYTDPEASQYDPNYQNSFRDTSRSRFTPIALTARANPARGTSGQFRTEYDVEEGYFKSFSASGTASAGTWLQVTAGWSQYRSLQADRHDDTLGASAAVRLANGRVGGTYAFNYDFSREHFVQQRFVGYYNAQCCGVAAEYQVYNLSAPDPRTGLSYDRRFNVSFTLAGVGTFSNFFGVFGGNRGQ